MSINLQCYAVFDANVCGCTVQMITGLKKMYNIGFCSYFGISSPSQIKRAREFQLTALCISYNTPLRGVARIHAETRGPAAPEGGVQPYPEEGVLQVFYSPATNGSGSYHGFVA